MYDSYYDTKTILDKISLARTSGTDDGGVVTQSSELDENSQLASLMPNSFAEIWASYQDVLTLGEAEYLSQAISDAQKKNKETESRILSRANPQLTSAVRMAIDQSRSQRDYDAQFGDRAQQYVAPGSVASMFSPAGYLTELYREARDLHTSDNARHLDKRRPDLTRLALSQDNMDAEVSTLSIANDIVLSSIISREGADDDTVMEKLSTWRLSGNTPYHLPYEGARQAILLQDPALAALEANPDVAQQVDLPSLLAILADVSPELYAILTEEITAENAAALYTKNFGTQDTTRLLNAYLLAGYYDIPANDVLTLTSLLGQRDYSDPVQYYANNILTTMTSTGDSSAGEVVQITRSGMDSTVHYIELLPQGGDSYLVNFSFKNPHEGYDNLRIGTMGANSNNLYNGTRTPQPNEHISIPVSLSADSVESGITLYICRYSPAEGVYYYAYANFKQYSLSAQQYLLHLNKILRLYKATGLTPEEMYLLVYNHPGTALFETGMLSLAFLSLFYRQHYSLRFEDALVLAGGHISAAGIQGQADYFTRLFNTPLLNNREFVADGAAVDWSATDADSVFRSSVIRRGCRVNGASFALDEFPNTGLIGVKFQVVMAGDAATNSDYNWSVDQAWLTVDEGGNVTFTGAPDELTRSVEVTAASIADGKAYVWRFTLSHWFATLGEKTMNAPNAVKYAADNGWVLPGIPDVVVMVNGEAQRVAGPHLWSEWGDLSVYPATGVLVGAGRYYWLQETVEVSLEQMHLTTTLTTIDNSFSYTGNAVRQWVLLMKTF